MALVQADGTTDATNVSSGSTIAKGGVGIAKKLFVGDATSIAGDVTANNILPKRITLTALVQRTINTTTFTQIIL